jgi:hypothetical protein
MYVAYRSHFSAEMMYLKISKEMLPMYFVLDLFCLLEASAPECIPLQLAQYFRAEVQCPILTTLASNRQKQSPKCNDDITVRSLSVSIGLNKTL